MACGTLAYLSTTTFNPCPPKAHTHWQVRRLKARPHCTLYAPGPLLPVLSQPMSSRIKRFTHKTLIKTLLRSTHNTIFSISRGDARTYWHQTQCDAVPFVFHRSRCWSMGELNPETSVSVSVCAVYAQSPRWLLFVFIVVLCVFVCMTRISVKTQTNHHFGVDVSVGWCEGAVMDWPVDVDLCQRLCVCVLCACGLDWDMKWHLFFIKKERCSCVTTTWLDAMTPVLFYFTE